MIDEDFIVPKLGEKMPATQHFPVIAQLSILGLVFIVIFISVIPQLFTKKVASSDTWVDSPAPISDSTTLNTMAVLDLGDISVKARSAYVYDVRAKRALYNKDADDVLPLASITKLMTVLIAEELINGTTTILIPKDAVLQDGNSGLSEGEKISTKALTDYAVMASSNDAAFALGAAVGATIGGNNPNMTFVNSMNLRADELGLGSLKFYNPTGLDISTTEAGAYGSARDISFLMKYILENHPDLLNPTTVANAKIYNSEGAYHEAENTDPIIDKIPNLLGSKTGYTDIAGGNLTIAFDAGFNRPIIITVLGSTFSGRFADVMTLVDAVNNAFINSK